MTESERAQDPGNLESNLQSGAQAGYALLWVLLWSVVAVRSPLPPKTWMLDVGFTSASAGGDGVGLRICDGRGAIG